MKEFSAVCLSVLKDDSIWIISALWKQGIRGLLEDPRLFNLWHFILISSFFPEKLSRRYRTGRKASAQSCSPELGYPASAHSACHLPLHKLRFSLIPGTQQLSFQQLSHLQGRGRRMIESEKEWWNEVVHMLDKCCTWAAPRTPTPVVEHIQNHDRLKQIVQQYLKGCEHSDTNLLYNFA